MLHKLPKLAYRVLNDIMRNETRTQEELVQALDAEEDGIKYAIRRLQEHDLIKQIPDLMDMRIVHYRLNTADEMLQVKDKITDKLFNRISTYVERGNHTRTIGDNANAYYEDPAKA